MTRAALLAQLKSARQFGTPISPALLDEIIKALGGKS